MKRGLTARAALLSLGALASVWFMFGGASAQQTAPPSGTQDCADFDTQEAAQAFYDQHKSDQPGQPDPFDLDTDGDGKACEGLPTAATTSASPAASVAPTATASPAAGNQQLPQNGAETGVIALSGLSLLEAGYGLTLASKRLGIRRRAIPLYLIRKFATAARKGEGHIEVGQDMYLVHRSVLETGPIIAPIAPVFEVAEEDEHDGDVDTPPAVLDDVEPAIVPNTSSGQWPNVYAALARPGAVPYHDD
jgi:hypothetical protein